MTDFAEEKKNVCVCTYGPCSDIVIEWPMKPPCVGGCVINVPCVGGCAMKAPCVGGLLLLKCCFTSTENVGLLGTGAQDGHLDVHTAPEL